MHRRVPVQLAVIAILCAFSPSASLQAANKSVGRNGVCSRAVLTPSKTTWIYSGVWSGPNLRLNDIRSRSILTFDKSGQEGAPLVFPGAIPLRLTASGNSYFLETLGQDVLTLDSGLAVAGRRNLFRESLQTGRRITAIFNWEVAGNDLIGLSDLQPDVPGKVQDLSAFLRFPLSNPAKYTVLTPYPSEAEIELYRLGHPFVATVGSTAYVLKPLGRVGILENQPGSRELKPLNAFPEGFDLPPLIPGFRTNADYPEIMSVVEQSAMPVGLYSWGQALFVLTRRPVSDGTEWALSKIDPARDQLLGTTVLPTRAHHLAVVPGPDQWAFLEKGRVKGRWNQELESVLYVSAKAFQGTPAAAICR